MFKIVSNKTWNNLNYEAATLALENEELKEENKRLFDFHNKRLQKPHQDKDGKWRDNEEKFTRAPE